MASKLPRGLLGFVGKAAGPVGWGLVAKDLIETADKGIVGIKTAEQEVATAIFTANTDVNNDINATINAIEKALEDELPARQKELAEAKSRLEDAKKEVARLKAVDPKSTKDELELAEAERQVTNLGEEGIVYVKDGTGTLGLISREIADLKIELARLLRRLEELKEKQAFLQKGYDEINKALDRLKAKLYQLEINVPEAEAKLLPKEGVSVMTPTGLDPLGVAVVTEDKNGKPIATVVGSASVGGGTVRTNDGHTYEEGKNIPAEELRQGFTYTIGYLAPTGEGLLPGVQESGIAKDVAGKSTIDATIFPLNVDELETVEDIIAALEWAGVLSPGLAESFKSHSLTITPSKLGKQMRDVTIETSYGGGFTDGTDRLELGTITKPTKVRFYLPANSAGEGFKISYTDENGKRRTTFIWTSSPLPAPAKVTKPRDKKIKATTGATKPTQQPTAPTRTTPTTDRPAESLPPRFEGYQTGPRSPQIFTPTGPTRPPLHTF